MNCSGMYMMCMCCRKRKFAVMISAAVGLALIIFIACITIFLCRQKRHAERAKQKLEDKMAVYEETVVKIVLCPYLFNI